MARKTPNHEAGTAVAGDTGAEQIAADGLSTSSPTEHQVLLTSPILGLILAGIAACAVWGALEATLPVFELSERLRELSGNAPEAQQRERLEASAAATNNNATLSLALLAATLGLVLTVAEAMLRRQGARAVWGGLLAALVAGGFAVGSGILVGALGGWPSLPEHTLTLTKTIVLQATTQGLLGLGVGLGVGLAVTLPGIRLQFLATCSAGGLLGGLVGGLIYPLASSVLLPNARTEISLPDPGISRLLWLALAAVAVALVLTGMVKEKKKQTAP